MELYLQNRSQLSWMTMNLREAMKLNPPFSKLSRNPRFRRTNGQIVMPIFYGIDPSVVRKKNGSYGVAFAQLEHRFEDRMEKVYQWRDALTEASNLCGLDSKDFRPEFKLVQKIVEDISLKLPKCQPSNEHYKKGGLIGIEENIKKVKSLLSIGSKDVRIIGIWGMGGIGKTTLASVVYQELSSSQFEGCSFLPNVKEECERRTPYHLRKKLLFELLNENAILKMDTPFVASPYIFDKLRRKKVFIVLDNVDDWIQLDALVEGYDQFAPGSRILVTTRNVQVLKKVADQNIYKMEGLSHNDSLELFRLHAFGKNSPPIDDAMLLKRVVSYADGNPLALKVLGCFLHSRNKQDWKNVLYNLQKFPEQNKIFNVLRTSYEGLDEGIQNIFLDIACLFNGSFTRSEAERLLDSGDSLVKIGMEVLVEKSLIEDVRYGIINKLRMHDLLRQMGQKIVCDRHTEPGHHSRLWDAKDVCHVLERNTGTVMVEVILFNLSEMTRDVEVCRAALSKMCNLRVLKIYFDNYISVNKFKLHLFQGLDSYLSEKLNYFHWDFYPLESMPSNFTPENLVELVLHRSHIQKLWNREVQSLPVLKRMDLSYSALLTEIPDLSQLAPNLESINLEGCRSLVRVLPCLENLDKLTDLNLKGCSKLRDFEETIHFGGIKNFLSKIFQQQFPLLKSFINNNILSLSSPQSHISLKFPMNLTVLNLQRTPIDAVPLSIESLSGLVKLDLGDCESLRSLPTSICKLKSLESLILSGCVKLEKFPAIFEPMELLESLIMSGAGITELPESIDNLISLKDLNLDSCKEIGFLPNKLCDLRKLEYLNLSLCSKLENLPPLPPALLSLEVQFCGSLKSLPDLPLFCERVYARHCTSLEKISDWRPSLQHQLNSESPNFCRPHRCADFMGRFANFFGCEKLDQNTRNTIIADYAIFKIIKAVNSDSDLNFCYPGDEIPKWFSSQSPGTSLKIDKLPPFWNNDSFLGLALCVVLDLNKIRPQDYVIIHFKLKFKTNIDDDCPPEFYVERFLWANKKCLDHVFIWYVPKDFMQHSEDLSTQKWLSSWSSDASFHVWASFSRDKVKQLESESCEIKKCGVWFVYKEDAERFNAETVQSI
ncbi:disease resistance-like protein DSC1 isoform X2 [Ziziphus jujuba]|uniref:ADP-ribosyl cyclase/cyclic ADP-ribose hydrolase n=1 Tax=Ziziphus jujuba TaxID=326968 RepID=A0ABM3I2T7_ZIZJJ|nr:disease resistance-like protein DSC1 isoform X2 [Ziziphus jujuba]